MATKQEIINDIRKNHGNMLNLREATNALGFVDKRAALRFLEGVPYCETGKEKNTWRLTLATVSMSAWSRHQPASTR